MGIEGFEQQNDEMEHTPGCCSEHKSDSDEQIDDINHKEGDKQMTEGIVVKKKKETDKHTPWGFGHFVGQCFSFTQITKQSTKQIEDNDNAKIVLLEERVSKMTKSKK